MSALFCLLFLKLKNIALLCYVVQELKTKLIQAGIYNHPIRKDHPLWVETLSAYREATGDFSANLSCGSCVNKIKRWLER